MLRKLLKKQSFDPSWLGVLTNSSYITRSRLIRAVRRAAHHVRGRVLDFGCGAKPYEFVFDKAIDYIGVDLLQSGHSHGESKIDIFYDGRVLPLPDASFDAVVSFEVFEHVFNLDDMLIEIRRVLKPGGTLLASIPFAWPEHEQPYDFARYTSFGLRSILERNGFEVIGMEKTSSTMLAVSQIFIAMIHSILERAPRPLTLLGRLFLIFPVTAIALVLDRIVPRQEEFFCNLVMVAHSTSRPVARD